MVEVIAKLRYARIAPRKMRLLADLVRGAGLDKAKKQLDFNDKKGAEPLLKLLKSAESNAKSNFKMEPDILYIKEIRVDGGPILKRWMPRARGRATMIRRRSSHVTVVLDEKKGKSI